MGRRVVCGLACILLFSGFWPVKSPVEALLERDAHDSGKEGEQAAQKLRDLRHDPAVNSELKRIAATAKKDTLLRRAAIMHLLRDTTAVPLMINLLDESNDTVRCAATLVLHSVFGSPVYEYCHPSDAAEKKSKVVARYKEWWKEHHADYVSSIGRIRKTAKTSPPTWKPITPADIPKTFREFAKGYASTASKPFQQIIRLGPAAHPELKRIARDTSVYKFEMAYLMLGAIGDTAILPFMFDSLEWSRTTKDAARVDHMIVQGLNWLLRQGAYLSPRDPKREEYISRYQKWWTVNKRLFSPP